MKNVFSKSTSVWRRLAQAPLDGQAWLLALQAYAGNGQYWQMSYVAEQLARVRNVDVATIMDVLEPTARQALVDVQSLLSSPVLQDAPIHAQNLQTWLKTHTEDWLSYLFLARVLDGCPQVSPTQWQAALDKARTLEWLKGESAHLLGQWRLKSGDAVGAVAVLSSLVDVRPLRHGSMLTLGEALMRLGNTQAAEVAFGRASHSQNPAVLQLLAQASFNHNYWREALDVLHKATALQPDNVAIWLQLARMQSQVFLISECRESLQRIQRLEPHHAEARLLEIGLMGQLGTAQSYFEALQAALQAQESSDGNTRLRSSVLMSSLYCEELSAQHVSRLHRQTMSDIEQRLGTPVRTQRRKHSTPGIVRVGYVTGDLHRQHPVNLFMLPLLQQQKDSPALEVYIYHTGTMYDAYTRTAQSCAKVWVDAHTWDDNVLHQKILSDEVDVLFDLAGHTASHRLGVFVKRAAPVQVSFLGYPHSTGLACMDYLIGDAVVSPEEHADQFSEKIVRLPGSVFCWAPVDDYPLPTHTREQEPVVFASFNNTLKLSPRTVALWARVLKAVPTAMLMLKAPSLSSPVVCERFTAMFAEHAIGADRLIFRGPSELAQMMMQYGEVDIALDPLPYNGGTTSLQALWMGVPLVSLLGDAFQNRMGASFLRSMGQTQWLAQTEDDYVRIAQQLAQQVHTVRHSRLALRETMKATVGNMKQYARHFEDALWAMRP